MSSRNANTLHQVLFIPSGSIGDGLMMIGLCAEMMRHDPNMKCTIIARRNAVLIRDLAAAYPAISVITIHKNLTGVLTLLWEALRCPWIVLMPAVFGKGLILNTRNLFTLLRFRPGTFSAGLLVREGDENPYDTALTYTNTVTHYDNMRRMARAAGLTVDAEGETITMKLDTRIPSSLIIADRSYVVYHPFGSSSWKSFPLSRSRALLLKLTEMHPRLSFVITGGPENEVEAEQIIQNIPRIQVAVGLPILEAAYLIEHAALYIGVDTGTTHLAGVLKQKSVIMEHNASPEWLPTYNPNAVILTTTEHCVCEGHKNDACKMVVDGKPYHRCLAEISDEMILAAVDGLLKP